MAEGDRVAENETNDEWTCGKGLAHHSAIPAKMAEYLAALAKTLRTHVPTIDRGKASGQVEWEAYTELATNYQDLAVELADTAARMRRYRDLPAAPHHKEALAAPVLAEVFMEFVSAERELADLMQKSVAEDEEILREIERQES